MEHQSSVTYGNGFKTDIEEGIWAEQAGVLNLILHIVGHEWFANNITYKDIADMWIQSFTNYSESLLWNIIMEKKLVLNT
jgi:aminopeptidase N